MYPIPRGRYRIEQGPFGKQNRMLDSVESTETGYSIPFTKKNLDKIRDIGLQSEGKVGYVINTGVIKISVATYEDLRDGAFDELAHFGRIPNSRQRQRWLGLEGGIEADRLRYEDVARKKTEREQGIPERNVTADEVREMIKKEVVANTAAASNNTSSTTEQLTTESNNTTPTTNTRRNNNSKQKKK